MEYRRLGRSGLMVSTLTLGSMTWGGEGVFAAVGSAGVAEARRQLDMAIDAGVNVVDTADVYSFGRSEEILGEVARGRRSRLVLATKAFARMGDGPHDRGSSRQHLIEACEASLKRLGTDYIDLYQLHGWDGLVPVEESLRALDDLVRAGKVRYIGVSNFSGWHLTKMLYEAEMRGLTRPIGHQLYYSLISRDAEWDLLPVAVDQDVGTMVWSPLASGLLSGKYRRNRPEPEGTRIKDWGLPPRPDFDRLYDIVDALVVVADAHGATPAQVALAWLLARPGISTLIVGARTEDQLADNLKAAELTLSAEEIAAIEKASRPPMPYPQWQQASISRDRLSAADLIGIGPHLA